MEQPVTFGQRVTIELGVSLPDDLHSFVHKDSMKGGQRC